MSNATLKEMWVVANMGVLHQEARDPIDNFVSAKVKQATLNSKRKKRKRKKFVNELVGSSSQVVYLMLQKNHMIRQCLTQSLNAWVENLDTERLGHGYWQKDEHKKS